MRQGARRFWLALFPRPRKPPTWWGAVPLILFLVVFGTLCASLALTGKVVFTSWWPLGLLLLTPWIWWMSIAGYSGLSSWRSAGALVVRLSICGLLIVTLTEPRTVRQDNRLTVVYAVDLSGSVSPEAVENARAYVSRIAGGNTPEGDLSALVYFGREAAVQLPPKAAPSPEELQLVNVRIGRDGSNIAQALAISAAILPPNQNGRIVLISDGVQTAGDLTHVLADLRARGISVDVLPVGYGYDEEVWIERLELPKSVKEAQAYEASILVSSLKAGQGKLILLENDQAIFEQEVSLAAGKNRFVVPIHLRTPGYYEYMARIEPATRDHVPENNVAMGHLFLEGQRRTLLVTNPQGDERDWKSLVQALAEAEFSTDTITSYELSRDPLALKVYDCIIFLNVPRDEFDEIQLQSVHDAVFHEGVGFLMVGGRWSFGPGGWRRTPIEQALPVEMDISQRKVLLNGALVFVLDHSGSMSGPVPGTSATKQVVANSAAATALEVLHSRDWLGVVAFDTEPTWVVPLALNTDSATAARKVRSIATGGGTNMYPALFEALKSLEGLPEGEAAVRHIVLLTDGQSGPGDLVDFVRRCRESRISVSTIGVGGPGDVDTDLLRLLAHESGGQFYLVNDARSLPRILIREAVTLRRSAFREDPFTPEAFLRTTVLRGIDAVPPLHGMVVTMLKNRAELVLAAPTDQEEEPFDPVLAVHRYGAGRTAAFTSDLSPMWGQEWVAWENYNAFVNQLVTEISRIRQDHHLHLDSFADGDEGVIQVEDHALEPGLLDVWALTQGPDRQTQQFRLTQVGPRLYQGRFPLTGHGRYFVTAMSNDERVSGGFVVPYSQEYLQFGTDPRSLSQIAESTGGRLLTGDEVASDIYSSKRAIKSNTDSIVELLLLLLALLIPLDVGARRIQLDWASIRGWFFRRRETGSGPTLDTLLKRKQTVAQTLQERRGPDLARPRIPSAPTKTSTVVNPVAEKPAAHADQDAPVTTTSRLLEAVNRERQRRRQE